MIPGGSAAVLGKKGDSIRDSWQCVISCFHIYPAGWRLEDSRELTGSTVAQDPSPVTNKDTQPTITTGTNTTQPPDPALELYLPPLSNHVLQHTVKTSRRIEWKTQFSLGYLHTYSLGVTIT